MTPSMPWRPLAVSDLQGELGVFTDWVLCGGYSIDLYLGKASRAHGDIDIGLFRSGLADGLAAFAQERVYLCDPPGTLRRWDGARVLERVHDIWIADRELTCWCLQVMVFDDTAGEVSYRREPRLRWPKAAHSIQAGGIRILNPWITFLYKAHQPEWEPKAIVDLANLITRGGSFLEGFPEAGMA